MTDTPQGIQIGRHRDLRGREWYGWLRRGLLLIPAAIVVLALANVFGQHPETSTASTSAATMSVFAPTSVRGGLIWEARFDVHAVRTIRDARLVLDSDWLEANTVYSVTGALIAVSTIALMQLGSSYLSFRSSRMRTVLEGDPMVVVQDGKPVARNLRRLRMTTDELAEEARGQGIASLDEVRWAIAEASGTVSFIQEG